MNEVGFSSVKLFILGLLTEKPRYGYEIVSVAEIWGVHRWASISIGATYHAIGNLLKSGYIEAGRTEKPTNRPERQVWQVLPAGRNLATSFVEQGLSSLDFEGREVDMALAFAGLLPPEQRAERLRLRLGPLHERLDQLHRFNDGFETCNQSSDPSLAEFRRLRSEQPWIAAGVRHGLGRLQHELTWTEQLLLEIADWPSVSDRVGAIS